MPTRTPFLGRVLTSAVLASLFLVGVLPPALAGTLGALPIQEARAGAILALTALALLRWPFALGLAGWVLAFSVMLIDEARGWLVHGDPVDPATLVLLLLPVAALAVAVGRARLIVGSGGRPEA